MIAVATSSSLRLRDWGVSQRSPR